MQLPADNLLMCTDIINMTSCCTREVLSSSFLVLVWTHGWKMSICDLIDMLVISNVKTWALISFLAQDEDCISRLVQCMTPSVRQSTIQYNDGSSALTKSIPSTNVFCNSRIHDCLTKHSYDIGNQCACIKWSLKDYMSLLDRQYSIICFDIPSFIHAVFEICQVKTRFIVKADDLKRLLILFMLSSRSILLASTLWHWHAFMALNNWLHHILGTVGWWSHVTLIDMLK